MPRNLDILDTMPSTAEFYGKYWNKRPFAVRRAIAEEFMLDLIRADELAGLSMEEAPLSRMVMTGGSHSDWSCQFGPFSEQDFATTGDADWSLLVQNVDQFHPKTAALLRHFNFTPRWLLDDIMVSFSARGGSVGAHVDSYHVFLVQGQGKRRWKIGHESIRDEEFIDGLDLKILKAGFDGETIEVTCGDVLYIPPKFGHEGTTLENALTYSVGFLGPKLSELFISYGQYLAECEERDQRYVGAGLTEDSTGFALSSAAVKSLRDHFSEHLDMLDFNQWLVEFFTEPCQEGFATDNEREVPLSAGQLQEALIDGASLIKPEYIKFAITPVPTASSPNGFCLGFDNQSSMLDEHLLPLVQMLMKEQPVNAGNCRVLFDHPACLDFIAKLYNHHILEFQSPEGEALSH